MNNITDQPGKSGQWVRQANVAMLAVVCGLAGYVTVKYFTVTEKEEPVVAEDVVRKEVPDAGHAVDLQVPPLSVYLNGIAQKNLFEPSASPAMTENAVLPAMESRIKLIGILVDKDPKAIVEDLQDNQTHFLSPGDSIGAVLLEEIREDKVIFMYQSERFEMSL